MVAAERAAVILLRNRAYHTNEQNPDLNWKKQIHRACHLKPACIQSRSYFSWRGEPMSSNRGF